MKSDQDKLLNLLHWKSYSPFTEKVRVWTEILAAGVIVKRTPPVHLNLRRFQDFTVVS